MAQQEFDVGERVRLYFFREEPLEVSVKFNGTDCTRSVSKLEGEIEACTSHALRLKNIKVYSSELGEHFEGNVDLGYGKIIYHRTIRHADILE